MLITLSYKYNYLNGDIRLGKQIWTSEARSELKIQIWETFGMKMYLKYSISGHLGGSVG